MEGLGIRLFGKFEVYCGQQPLDGFDAHKLQQLLGYLLLHRDRPHPREVIASVLWQESTTAQSKKNLRHALWRLQGLLEPYTEPAHGPLLLVGPDWIEINPEIGIWVDVAAFERSVDPLQAIPGEMLRAQDAEALQKAVRLYRGDLLEGFYDDWCLFERERLQNVHLAVLDKLMAYHEAQGAYRTCLAYGVRLLRYDRASERTHRRLMRAHYRAGDRTAALRQYQSCVAALRQELDVGPGARTQELYRQIRADALDDPAPLPKQAPPEADVPSSLQRVLQRFRQLESTLVDLHREVERDIQLIEGVLPTPSAWPPAQNRSLDAE